MSKPPVEVPQGAIRFNTDSQKMEFFAQDQWWEMATDVPNLNANGGPSDTPSGNSADYSLGARGIAIGGNTQPAGVTDKIDYINIASAGNAIDFGNMVINTFAGAGLSSRTRAVVVAGRQTPGSVSDIQYLTMASTGDTIDWGSNALNSLGYGIGAVSNQTRGITMGGYNTSNTRLDDIQYLTIASLGSINDFGNLTANPTDTERAYCASVNSPTRGLVAGGTRDPNVQINNIEYITIASTGNAQDFGDLSVAGYRVGGCMSSTRGLIAFGETPAGDGKKNIDYVTIATLGNAAIFGDLTVGGQHPVGTSDSVRGVWLGRQNSSPYSDNEVIDYNTIATQGDAVDFGNLVAATSMPASASTGHGGL